MLLENRKYSIEPGRRDEFLEFFDSKVLPAMEAKGMRVIGQFTSTEYGEVFWYPRSFDDDEDRERSTKDFYESTRWIEELRDPALAMETGYEVDVVIPTPGSRMQ